MASPRLVKTKLPENVKYSFLARTPSHRSSVTDIQLHFAPGPYGQTYTITIGKAFAGGKSQIYANNRIKHKTGHLRWWERAPTSRWWDRAPTSYFVLTASSLHDERWVITYFKDEKDSCGKFIGYITWDHMLAAYEHGKNFREGLTSRATRAHKIRRV